MVVHIKNVLSRLSTLIIEIVLTICICAVIGVSVFTTLQSDAKAFANRVDIQYRAITDGYLTTFKAFTLQVREELNKNPSLEELDAWLKNHENAFSNALGKNVYDGYYVTYRGSLARSWSYGDYSNYKAENRQWYIQAAAAKGQAVVVAPYSSYLSDTAQTSPNPINLTVAQRYSNDITFAMDLRITDINALLADQDTEYEGSLNLLLDKNGNILSANDKQYYSHNIHKADNVMSVAMQSNLEKALEKNESFIFTDIDGSYRMVYMVTTKNGNVLCQILPFRVVFIRNFLQVILIAVLLLILEIAVYLTNRRRMAVFAERDRRMSTITNAAFQERYYIDLDSMLAEGNSKDVDHQWYTYQQVYDTFVPTITSAAAKEKFQRLFSPEALHAAPDMGLTSVRVPVSVKNEQGTAERRMLEFSIIVVQDLSQHKRTATVLVNDVTEDATHQLMILQSIAAHYDWAYMGNIKTRYYEAIKIAGADLRDVDEWNPQATARDLKEEYKQPFVEAIGFDRIAARFQYNNFYRVIVQFTDEHWYAVWIIRSLTYAKSGEFFVCFENADEQMRYQLELESALAKANVAAQAKSDFLSRMSHDIRTPLNGIIGMTTIAQKRNMDPEMERCLSTIQTSGHFLLGLINDILDIVKIESGQFELHEEPAALSELDDMIHAVVQPIMAERDIHFTYQAEPLTQYALIDLRRFCQICFNLLSNAAKYTQVGGDVAFLLTSLRMEKDVEWVKIVVRDNGIGMTPEFLERLFNPFEQENEGNDSVQWKGTGLGLSIAKELTEKMGGHIYVASEKGKGSTFTLEMPIKPCHEPVEKKAAAIHAASHLKGKIILLAEDNKINTIVAKTILEDMGMTVICVVNGKEAVDTYIAAEHIDAILMDVMMPMMNGIEATKAIRSLNRKDAHTVPIIAVTANAFQDDVQTCLDAGMNAHVAKPIEPKQLQQTLEKFL